MNLRTTTSSPSMWVMSGRSWRKAASRDCCIPCADPVTRSAKPKPVSLRLRLALFGAAVVALTLLIFGGLLYALLSRSVSSNQDDALRARAQSAAHALEGTSFTAQPAIAPADLGSSTDIYVEVLDASGLPLYTTAQLNGTPPPIPAGLRDQVALLSASFNRMLEALDDAYRTVAAALDAQRRFVADASHELRTPLATIQGNAGLLVHGPDVGEDIRRSAAADIAGESDRMARLTDRLLTLARADSGLKLQLAPVELRPLVAEVVRQAASLHGGTTFSLQAAEVPVAGDPDALRQLLWNLLDNAVRHARAAVVVTLQKEGNWARLMVADDGNGVPASERERIFERFYKVDAARAGAVKTERGAGLGLAIARWIAEQHGGRIIATDGPAGGAGFFVDIPPLSPS